MQNATAPLELDLDAPLDRAGFARQAVDFADELAARLRLHARVIEDGAADFDTSWEIGQDVHELTALLATYAHRTFVDGAAA